MSDFATQHTDAMRVSQAQIHAGDARYYIVTANGFVVRGPFPTRETAEVALENLRNRVAEELTE